MMKQLFGSLMAIVDVIMPPKARTVRAKALTIEKLSLAPTTHELLGTRIVTLMDYRMQDVQDVIQSLKYDAANSSARLCAEALAEYLAEEITEARLFSQKRVLLVPVPLHASRARDRGYDRDEPHVLGGSDEGAARPVRPPGSDSRGAMARTRGTGGKWLTDVKSGWLTGG